MKKVLAVAVAFAFCAGAYAGIVNTTLVPVDMDNPGDQYGPDEGYGTNVFSFDLTVEVEDLGGGLDDWTITSIYADALAGATWFQHPNENPNGLPPFAMGDEKCYDTFYTYTGPNFFFQNASFANITETPVLLDVTWFDTPPNGGPGTWRVARISIDISGTGLEGPVTVDQGDVMVGAMEGGHNTVDGADEIFPYAFALYAVPEPASLALLGLGLALLRRR